LRIVLSEALELPGTPAYDFFDIPGGHIFGISDVKLFEEVRVRLGETPSGTQGVFSVYMVDIDVKDEEFDKGFGIREALQD